MTDAEIVTIVVRIECEAILGAFFMLYPEAKLYEAEMLALAKTEPPPSKFGIAWLEHLFNRVKWGVS